MIRVNGDVRRINLPPMEHKDVHRMIYDIMNDSSARLRGEPRVDFSFDSRGWRASASTPSTSSAAPARCSGRFRRRCCRWKNSTARADLQGDFRPAARLVLVTGPTGSGKSTTLAAMVDYVNEQPVRAHPDDRGPDRVRARVARSA
jgi:twitching motility protein PilT